MINLFMLILPRGTTTVYGIIVIILFLSALTTCLLHDRQPFPPPHRSNTEGGQATAVDGEDGDES